MSICPSIRMEQLGFHQKDFHEIQYLSFFRKSIEKIQVSLKWDKNKGYFTWRPIYICYHISLSSSYNEMFQTKVVGKMKTNMSCSLTFFLLFWKSCRLWENVEKYCRAGQATYDNMAHAHCMLDTYGYKHTLDICNNYRFSTATIVVRTRLIVTLVTIIPPVLCFPSNSFHLLLLILPFKV
jgi:hypothetical protein